MRRFGSAGRADAFAAALDGQGGNGQPADPLLRVAQRLQQLPAPPTPRFDGTARAMLLAAAAAADLASLGAHSAQTGASATALSDTAAVSTAPALSAGGAATTAGLGPTLLPIMAGVLATAIGAGGVGVAAHRATPGAPFYAVKKAAETVQLDLTHGRTARAKAHLGFAAARLQEIVALSGLASSPTNSDRIGHLLDEFQGQVGSATDPLLAGGAADQTRLWNALHASTLTLSSLASRLPISLQPQLSRTLTTMAATQGLVAGLLGSPRPPGSPVGPTAPVGQVPSRTPPPASGATSRPGVASTPTAGLPIGRTPAGTIPPAATVPVVPVPSVPAVLPAPHPQPTTLPPIAVSPTPPQLISSPPLSVPLAPPGILRLLTSPPPALGGLLTPPAVP